MSLQKILLQYEPKPENLLRVLKEVQKENKYIKKEECKKIAEYFSMSLARVYSLASFFDEIQAKKNAKKIIKVCSGGLCLMKGSMGVVRQIELLLHLEVGNDAHPKYRLEFVSCRGLCDRGPIIMVDEQVFEKARAEEVDDIIKNYI